MNHKLDKLKKRSNKLKKRECNYLSDSTNKSWGVGSGSMGEWVHVAHVENKFEKLKLETSNPTNPIYTTPPDNNLSSFLEQKKTLPQHVLEETPTLSSSSNVSTPVSAVSLCIEPGRQV